MFVVGGGGFAGSVEFTRQPCLYPVVRKGPQGTVYRAAAVVVPENGEGRVASTTTTPSASTRSASTCPAKAASSLGAPTASSSCSASRLPWPISGRLPTAPPQRGNGPLTAIGWTGLTLSVARGDRPAGSALASESPSATKPILPEESSMSSYVRRSAALDSRERVTAGAARPPTVRARSTAADSDACWA